LLDPPDRWGDGLDQLGVPVVLDPHRGPGGAVAPVPAPPEVVDLAGDEVGAEDVAGGRPPGPVGAEGGRGAVGVGDVELGEQRGGRPVVVDPAGQAWSVISSATSG